MITYDMAVYTVLFAITAFVLACFCYMCKVDKQGKKIEEITEALENNGICLKPEVKDGKGLPTKKMIKRTRKRGD